MLTDETMLAVAVAVAKGFELLGIAVIVIGALYAIGRFVWGTFKPADDGEDAMATFRRMLGRSILSGLELLVAADIIRTVAVEPTLESVLVLALVVLIRTFLSFSLEVEINGRWPWQQEPRSTKGDRGRD